MYVFPLAAGYNLIRAGTSTTFFSAWFQKKVKGLNLSLAWVGFLLDQVFMIFPYLSICVLLVHIEIKKALKNEISQPQQTKFGLKLKYSDDVFI